MEVPGNPFDLRIRGAMGRVVLSVERGTDVISQIVIPAERVPEVIQGLREAVTGKVRPVHSNL